MPAASFIRHRALPAGLLRSAAAHASRRYMAGEVAKHPTLPTAAPLSLPCAALQHRCCASFAVAGSKYEYVKKFEQSDQLLPACFIVVRIDGKGFTK